MHSTLWLYNSQISNFQEKSWGINPSTRKSLEPKTLDELFSQVIDWGYNFHCCEQTL